MSYFSFMFPMSCQHIFLYFVWSWLIKILYILEFRILLNKQFIETHYILYYPFYNHMIYILCSLMCNYYGLNHVMIISKQSTFNICWDYFLNMKCSLQLGLYLTKVYIYTIFVGEIWGGVISSSNCFAKFSNICGVDGDEVTIIGTINSDTRPPPLLSIEHPP